MGYYDKIAFGYNELYSEEQSKKVFIVRRYVKINKNSRLLDVGCGTGISSSFSCFVVGIDPSIELLKQNSHRKVIGAAEALPFKNNTFDYVISVTAIHNFSNPKKSIREMKRVGKYNFIITLLRKSGKYNHIAGILRKEFNVMEVADGEKDDIFICGKKA